MKRARPSSTCAPRSTQPDARPQRAPRHQVRQERGARPAEPERADHARKSRACAARSKCWPTNRERAEAPEGPLRRPRRAHRASSSRARSPSTARQPKSMPSETEILRSGDGRCSSRATTRRAAGALADFVRRYPGFGLCRRTRSTGSATPTTRSATTRTRSRRRKP